MISQLLEKLRPARALAWRIFGPAFIWLEGAPSTLPDEAIPYQTDIDEIVAERPPRYLRSVLYLVVGMFLTCLIVAWLRKVDVVVVGPGQLVSESPPIVLQPLERSIIRELNVQPGDIVTKGQVLAKLDPTFTQADLASLSSQQRSVLAQIRGLEAVLKGGTFVPGSVGNSDDDIQLQLFTQRQAQYHSRLRSYDEDILRLQASLHTAEDDRDSLTKQLGVARDVEGMRSTLMQLQTGSKLQLLDSQAVRMRIERDYQSAVNRKIELEHELQSKQAERQSFMDEWRRRFLEELVTARTEAAKLGDGLIKATRMNDLVVVTAPEDGVILEVAKRSVGSVMREAEALVSMIPSNAPLMAEITIGSADVGYTRPGQDVVMKVEAFPYLRHGLLKGKLISVSEESFSLGSSTAEGAPSGPGRAGGAVHKAWVKVTDSRLTKLPEGARLIPGMTLAADIKVGTRSVLSFFTNPITRGLNESIQEP